MERTLNTQRAAAQDVGVDHCGGGMWQLDTTRVAAGEVPLMLGTNRVHMRTQGAPVAMRAAG